MDLISAATSGDTVAVRKLLAQRDADPNTRGLVQATATTASHFAVLHPALINSPLPSQEGETPLMAAARMGQVDVVRLLLSHPGVDANATDKKVQCVPVATH